MPLIHKLHLSRDMTERVHDASLQVKDSDSVRDQKHRTYEDFGNYQEDECMDSDMEGSIIHRPRSKKPTRTPSLPQRSEKRASKMLDDAMKSLDGSQQKDLDKTSMVQESDPHELYLSSEEDASLSDYDDSLFDLDLDLDIEAIDQEVEEKGEQQSTSRPSSRKGHARAVSITSVKPQIITIVSSSSSTTTSPTKTRSSMDLETLASNSAPSSSPDPEKQIEQQASPLKRRSMSIHRMSVSSIASLAHSSSSSSNSAHMNQSFTLPPRKSSRLAAITSLIVGTNKNTLSTSPSHAFLNTDPFAIPQSEPEADTPTTPKTPVSVFKKGLTRGLARRKPSMQRLSEIYAAQNSSHASLSLAPETAPETLKEYTPVRYEDIMKSAIRVPPPQPMSPKGRTSSMFAGRRKSIGIRY